MKQWHDDEASEKLWLSRRDIEGIAKDELIQAKLYPTMISPAVDIERFIEQYLRARLDQFADLGPLVEGQTEFFAGCPPFIQISRTLAEAADAKRPGALVRMRSTMAHEAGHVILHACQFANKASQLSLFAGDGGTNTGRLYRCSGISFNERRGWVDWREVQANMCMAALLMPQEHFVETVEEAMERARLSRYRLYPNSPETWSVIADVSQRLLVSKQAVSIRLEVLGLLVPPGQEPLPLHEDEDEFF